MELHGNGVFLGQETKISQHTQLPYTIVRVADKNGKIFEMMSSKEVKAEQYKPCVFVVEVTQGKFPKFNLISLT